MAPRHRGDGQWGEHHEGNISVSAAIDEFHVLERELTSRSRRTDVDGKRMPSDGELTQYTGTEDGELELPEFLRRGPVAGRAADGQPAKKLGVSFRNLTVKGTQADKVSVKTLPRAILNTFGPDLWNFFSKHVRFSTAKAEQTTDILRDLSGAVRPGEIMLVLGRPGSGCSTFLKTIANHRNEYASVDGQVCYGAMSARHQDRQFRGEVVYCEEDDRHFPSLTVWQTLTFAMKNKTKKKEEWIIPAVLDSLLQMFGIMHTKDTLVGDSHTRGVSGGERKRVSLAETFATNASVVCWDNSTRGLDASTALKFVKSLRVYTDVTGKTTLATLYQAGESIYRIVDKVLVLDEGRMIFQGSAVEAKQYFEDLGFLCPPRQNTPDFLTSITDTSVRQFRPGHEHTVPKTPQELEQAFRQSPHYQRLIDDVEAFELEDSDPANEKHTRFEATVHDSKSKHVTSTSSYTVSYARQVMAALQRQIWLFKHERSSFYTKSIIIFVNAIIVSSLFSDSDPMSTSSAFSKSSIAFFAIAFIGWVQFGELAPAIEGRATIERQQSFAFYRPSAVVLARAIVDIPVLLFLVILFTVPYYFIAKLDYDAGKFGIFFLTIYFVSYSVTAMFRMLAGFSATVDDALRWVGVFMNLMFICTGYVIPRNTLLSDVPWLGWISYANPISFGFEMLLVNEFDGLEMTCSESQLVPRGVGAQVGYQGCSLPGSQAGSTLVDGIDHIETSYDFRRENLWRNFAIVVAFTVLFLVINIITIDRTKYESSSAQSLVFAKSPAPKKQAQCSESSSQQTQNVEDAVQDNNSVFTFEDITYDIPHNGRQLRLLNGVSGYAVPGKMIALMGSSGAGKTTLLNTLSQRQRVGIVAGDMLVNGSPLAEDFQRATGFCEQQDIHEESSTIREALEFSALLRQERDVPKEEKIAFVDQIMTLLELDVIEHALISSLNVEQRKRVTIGVELAAKPSFLLFLDEPTSGLDSQSAYSIVRFLKKLCSSGLAIICTIHQPSSDLIQQFDMILALNPGGRTFYFGPVGENGSVAVDYFAARGFCCPPDQNIAEFILETAANPLHPDGVTTVNWPEEWRHSDEAARVLEDIRRYQKQQYGAGASNRKQTKFAASTWYQCHLLTKRIFLKNWREPSYVYSRLFLHVAMGLAAGFVFWDQSNTAASLQNRMFSSLILAFFVSPTVLNSNVASFFDRRDLWEDRELPSCTYGWVAFCTANLVTEIPISIVASTVYWVPFYFPIGFPVTASISIYSYLMTVLWSIFTAGWGQWIAASGPSYSMVSNIIPFFLVVVSLFNGMFAPYWSFPDFWKYWMYYVNPLTWYCRGVLSATLPEVSVQCAESEFAIPPDLHSELPRIFTLSLEG